MFATSTKTATFLPTMTPQSGFEVIRRRVPLLDVIDLDLGTARGGPIRGHGSFDEGRRHIEAHAFPPAAFVRIVRPRGLDDGAAFVAGGTQKLLEERRTDAIDIATGIDQEPVH